MKTDERKRVPKKHVDAIRSIAQALGPQPRYVIARALVNQLSVEEKITIQTALDYVLASVKEGILRRMGDNLVVR